MLIENRSKERREVRRKERRWERKSGNGRKLKLKKKARKNDEREGEV